MLPRLFAKFRFRGPALGGLAVSLLLVAVRRVHGQELLAQKHPLSTYLDLRPALAGAAPQAAPSWVESFDFIPAAKAGAGAGTADHRVTTETGGAWHQSIFRVRVLHPSTASDHLQMRIFFEDRATGPRPRVSVWNELGEKMMSKPIGEGLGLPSCEALTVFMNGANYLEIEAPGDGSQVRGIFLSWMEPAEVLQASDFPGQEAVRQPFGILPQARTQHNDAYLLGTVTARLHGSKPVVMNAGSNSPATTFEFELEHQPLMAVVTYEALGAAIDAPPTLTVNGRALGAAEFYLPDLSDPAFRGETREAETQTNFRYTGWLRAQKVIPADALAAGLNNLTVKLSNTADSVAIRSVSIQLKYNWDKLDTVLVPAPIPYENR